MAMLRISSRRVTAESEDVIDVADMMLFSAGVKRDVDALHKTSYLNFEMTGMLWPTLARSAHTACPARRGILAELIGRQARGFREFAVNSRSPGLILRLRTIPA